MAELATQSAQSLSGATRWRETLLNLAVAGRTTEAERLASRFPFEPRSLESFLRAGFEEEIVALRIATSAKADPSKAVSLAVLGTLGDPRRISQTLRYVALDLAGEQPYTRGGVPWIVDAEKAHANRHRADCGSDVEAVLRRWLEVVDDVPPAMRNSAYVELADAYSLCRDAVSAVRILNKIDENTPTRALDLRRLSRSWLQAGDIDRALAVALRLPDPKQRVESCTEVASAYARAGRQSDALSVVSSAFQSVRSVSPLDVVKLWAGLIDVERQTGEVDRAMHHAEEAALIAEKSGPFEVFDLIRVAAVFNDLDRSNRSVETLEKALRAIPPSDGVVAFGFVAGPIRYGTSGLDGEALEQAAVQFYRAGLKAKAVTVIRQADALHRRRAAVEIVRSSLTKSPLDSVALAEEMRSDNPAELLLVAVATRIEKGDAAGASEFFERFMSVPLSQDQAVVPGTDLNAVRLAVMLSAPKYTTYALRQGLRDITKVTDPNLRTYFLSELAAYVSARLP